MNVVYSEKYDTLGLWNKKTNLVKISEGKIYFVYVSKYWIEV